MRAAPTLPCPLTWNPPRECSVRAFPSLFLPQPWKYLRAWGGTRREEEVSYSNVLRRAWVGG